jgi:hypothetical protein
MKYHFRAVLVLIAICLIVNGAPAQKPRKAAKPKASTTVKFPIFAVSDPSRKGTVMLEPITMVENGKLSESAEGDGDEKAVKKFQGEFHKPKATYALIFGGSAVGKVLVKPGDLTGECTGNRAEATLSPPNSSIKGLVMALATNAKLTNPQPSYRRKPTAEERTEIEKLVRAEFKEQNVPDAALKKLRYQNLAALDVDHDGEAEFVGSYWTETATDRRDLLFFIAEKGADGTYSLTYKHYGKVTPGDVMSGDVKDLDSGIGHELLLDVFDYDNDGVAEIFTILQAFEGNNFFAYKRKVAAWEKVLEAYNYHCAY